MTLPSTALLPFIGDIFQQMPFNQLLGLRVTDFSAERAEVRFSWNSQLVGNPVQQILHGGVIASVLDVVGGIMAVSSALLKLDSTDAALLAAKLGKMSTIDIRTDYLRPGRGREFIATAQVIRSGNKVCVCRMELHNDEGVHIALGTGTYLVG